MRDTLPQELRPLMELPSIVQHFCCVCGRTWPLNQHHVPARSAGKLFSSYGVEIPKPTVTLCGSGNTSGCHGLAHHQQLHFRNNNGQREYLITDEPTKYWRALEMEGWKQVKEWSE